MGSKAFGVTHSERAARSELNRWLAMSSTQRQFTLRRARSDASSGSTGLMPAIAAALGVAAGADLEFIRK